MVSSQSQRYVPGNVTLSCKNICMLLYPDAMQDKGIPVLAPEVLCTAERAKDPVEGYAQNAAPAKLDTPNPACRVATTHKQPFCKLSLSCVALAYQECSWADLQTQPCQNDEQAVSTLLQQR